MLKGEYTMEGSPSGHGSHIAPCHLWSSGYVGMKMLHTQKCPRVNTCVKSKYFHFEAGKQEKEGVKAFALVSGTKCLVLPFVGDSKAVRVLLNQKH